MKDYANIKNQIYSGVLGKLIGVYLGRPIEGWSYRDIQRQFGTIQYYVHTQLGLPLIVADDDISGTFGFFRALEDHEYSEKLSAAQIGEAWLNYIIEDKTILWWGGRGRSTEHTAYLNLKQGIEAPRSGSVAINGQSVAEQIGAQIFIEAFAMCFPGDPERAVALVRKAASVSHDGLAVDAACHLAAMDALAFEYSDLKTIFKEAERFISDPRLRKLRDDVIELCNKNDGWRKTREDLDQMYGYQLYPGSCHVAPNHAMVLASILHGGDDFQVSVSIAASAGWDTDCNAGNVGAFNGIRLGLAGIDRGADLRREVADRMNVITSDGGSAVTDAVAQANHIFHAACKLNHWPHQEQEASRFSFPYQGSLQGFTKCPDVKAPSWVCEVVPTTANQTGIEIRCCGLGQGLLAAASTPTFIETDDHQSNYLSTASPALYETQTIRAKLYTDHALKHKTAVQLYIVFDGLDGRQLLFSPKTALAGGEEWIMWNIPKLGGRAILRVGIAVSSEQRFDGSVRLIEMDWAGAPAEFIQNGIFMSDIWDTNPKQLQMWTSSAKQFAADSTHMLCVSHPEWNGLATIGTLDWTDYTAAATIVFGAAKAAGMVLRCKGHRQYYAAAFSNGNAYIILMSHGSRKVLAQAACKLEPDSKHYVSFSCCGSMLTLKMDDSALLHAEDSTFSRGGCGFLVDCGTILVDDISIYASRKKQNEKGEQR